MVSLSRLLAAARDAPARQPTPPPPPPPPNCIVPPALLPDALPSRLRHALDNQSSTSDQQPQQQRQQQNQGVSSSSSSNSTQHPSVPLTLQRLLHDLGPEATAPRSMTTLARTLAHFGRPSEHAVASALLYITTTDPDPATTDDSLTTFHLFALFCADPENPTLDPAVQQAVAASTPSAAEWRPDILVQAVAAIAEQASDPLNWRLVLRAFDVDGLQSRLTQPVFAKVAAAITAGTALTRLPAEPLVEQWAHAQAQVCMLTHALASPNLVDWSGVDTFDGATAEDMGSPYARVRLVERLVELEARDLLQRAIQENAEALLLSLTCSKPKSNSTLQQKLTVTLLTPLITVFPSSQKVIRQLWSLAPTLIEAGLISMWKKDAAHLRVALAISLDLRILPDLLSTGTSTEFALEMAILAYQAEVLDLETWLGDLLSSRGLPAVSACTLHMVQKSRSADPSAVAQMPLDAVRIIFRCLVSAVRKAGGAQAQDLMDGVREVLETFCRINPRIADFNPEADVGDRHVLIGTEVVAPLPVGQSAQNLGIASSTPGVTQTTLQQARQIAQPMAQPGASNVKQQNTLQAAQVTPAIARDASGVAFQKPQSPLIGVAQRPMPQSAATAPATAPATSATDALLSDAASTAAAMFLPMTSSTDGSPAAFPGDVEADADVFFGKLYLGEMPTEEAVEFLRRLKMSTLEHERHVFHCTMHTLFDEYRFFHKYPDRELKITGMLFGSIIQVSLVTGGVLGLAVRCVLDALQTVEPAPQPIGRLSKFGLCALERFRARLHEWPQYCGHILELTRLKDIAPELVGEVRKAWERTASSLPSAEEKRLGITTVDVEAPNEPVMATDGVPPAASVPDPVESANNVTSLLASPTISASNTPVKESISSSSLRPSPSTLAVDGALGLSALNLTTLLGMSADEASQVTAPDEPTQDKIKFIFNNLSTATMDDKVDEILAILDPEWQRYFSIYIVVKRASSESNFHHLYITMLDRVEPQLPTLYPMVYDTSYRRVRVVLSGDKPSTSSGRVVLKSLGSWIGSLTIARNKPILRRELDMKELLMDAYSNGRLTTVVPFVSKVLEACNRSKIFKTTNPWVRGILSLMKEIYSVPDLKLNMKFELQILCKGLGADVNEIRASDLLKGRPAPEKAHNPDFTQKTQPGSSPPRTSPSPTAFPSPELGRPSYGQGQAQRPGMPMFSMPEQQPTGAAHSVAMQSGQLQSSGRLNMNPNLVSNSIGMSGSEAVGDLSSILASTSLSANVGNNQMQRNAMHIPSTLGVPTAAPAQSAQRNTSIPQESTTLVPNLSQYVQVSPSLVLFQNSPHLKRLIPIAIDRAIREIIQPVVERSCAIAFLTTKELTLKDFANEPDPSKMRRAALQMVQQLAGSLALVTSKEPLRVSMGNQLRLLLSPSPGDQNLVEQTAQMVCASNLEIGCAVIERHAKEKAARDLNDKIGTAFAQRRPQLSNYNYGIAPGPEVVRVYDEFARLHRVGNTQLQYNGAQATGTQPHATHQHQVQAQVAQHTSLPMMSMANQRQVHTMSDQRVGLTEPRANGSVLEPKLEVRSTQVQPPQSAIPLSPRNLRNEPVLQLPITTARRPSPVPQPVVEPPPITLVYGTPLPHLATPTSVASAILAAAGSSNTSGSAQVNLHSPNAATQQGHSAGEEVLTTPQVLERFNTIYPQLTAIVAEVNTSQPSGDPTLASLPSDHEIHNLWIQIPAAVKRSVTADEAGMAVAQKVFKRLFEGDSNLYREVHVQILEGIRECCRRLSKELSSWLAYSEDRRKLHRECIVALIKPGSLLNITGYDEVLTKAIDNGRNSNALDFACFLVRRAVIDEPLATIQELYLTLEAMAKVARRSNPPTLPSCPEGLNALIEAARNVVHVPSSSANTYGGNDSHHAAAKTSKDVEPSDPAGVREYIAGLLLEWQRILSSSTPERPVPEHVVASFLAQLRVGAMNSEDARDRFFRISIELTTAATRAALQANSGSAPVAADLADAPYTIVEGLVRLVGTLCRPDPSGNADSNHTRAVNTLCQFLIAVVKDVLKSADGSDLRPHLRLISGLISELTIGMVRRDTGVEKSVPKPKNPDNALSNILDIIRTKGEALQFLEDKNSGLLACVRNAGGAMREKGLQLDSIQTLTAVCGALACCSPLAVPGFAFSWLQLISNKELIPALIYSTDGQGWPLFRHLIVRALEFLSKYLGDSHKALSKGIRTLYSGMLRVLLVLLHDFPEFLCAYHMSLCDVIPQNCIQLRNVVLASFPKDMRLPDPFLPELNVDELPEMMRSPLMLSDVTSGLEISGLRGMLDGLLRVGGSGMDVERLLCDKAKRYNARQVGAVVMYIGQHAVGSGNSEAGTQVLRVLTRGASAEGLHYVLNAIANQLRYPNNHTMYFSNVLLLLFHEAHKESVKEQITRVLVERLIANRPHPWGLLVTFVQLIKNTEYNFWAHGFVRCAPEIEQLFENVAKFCVGPAVTNKQQVHQQQQQQLQQQLQHHQQQQQQQQQTAASSAAAAAAM